MVILPVMKTAISVPDDVFKKVDRAAKRLGISRSELFTRAVRKFMVAERDAAISASYDEAFSDGADDPKAARFRRAAARKTLLSVEWVEE